MLEAFYTTKIARGSERKKSIHEFPEYSPWGL